MPRWLCVSTAIFVAGAVAATEGLTPGVTLERLAEVDQIASYQLRIGVGERASLAVEQLGADVVLTAHWGSADPWRVDAPLDRDGQEIFLLPPSARGAVEIELQVTSAVGPAPRYRIRFDLLPEVTAEAQRLEALGALTAAGRGYAEGSGEGQRRALDFYLRGAKLWRDLGEERLAAQALHAASVLHRLLGEHIHGIELAKQVLPVWQTLGDRAFETATWNGIGLMESSAGHSEEARQAFRQARDAQGDAGDPYRRAAIANNLCLTYLSSGDLRRGIDCYGPALATIQAAGDRETESVALANLGRAHEVLGEPIEAQAAYDQALEILRDGAWPTRQAQTLTRLGMLHRALGEPEVAVGLHFQALESFRRLGDRYWQALTLHNLGATYYFLGDRPRAEALLLEGLSIHQELENQNGEATSWKVLGHLYLADERPAEAHDAYRRARNLERATGDAQGEATAASFLARAQLGLGDPQTALATLDAALGALRDSQAPRSLAGALIDRGRILIALGQPPSAIGSLEEALQLYRRLGDPRGEGWASYLLARAHRANGQNDAALSRLDQALELFETLRVELGDPDLQATFAGARRGAYELRVELLAAENSGEQPAAAFAASERARAWGITGLLRRTGAGWSAGLERQDPELAERLRSAQRSLHAVAGRRAGLGAATTATGRQQAEAAVVRAQLELEDLERAARQSFPEVDGLAEVTSTVAEAQALLDPGTALLEYLVGEERGFLFVVTQTALRRFELPGRAALEAVVRRARQELDDPLTDLDAWLHGSAAELTRQIFHPALPALEASGVERLVIVADGALHYLPFGALPVPPGAIPPGTGRSSASTELMPVVSHPLLERFEVTYLPSAGVLALERQRRARRPAPTRTVAVLADPVFDVRDLRLASGHSSVTGAVDTARGFEAPAGHELPRLRASQREAKAIAALAPADDAFVALGFEAHRDQILDGDLNAYRVLHFATHGIIDDRHAVLSGLVLSRFDAAGQPRDGFLGLRDIFRLDLRADLVVLSACRTALGKEVRGEGLLGLTRAFLHAGASRVMASLWSVPDRATAELMERFYRALWRDGVSPSAALRRAQRSMLAERRWSAPNQWAGFVLIGDWRPPPPRAR